MKENLTIGFIGNPNCGKTTLFNAYTGANLKVANWPGVTVEKVEGAIRDHNLNIRLVDLPGTYSLTSYTMEEQVSRQFILSDEVDMIIDVVDASALERNAIFDITVIGTWKTSSYGTEYDGHCRKAWDGNRHTQTAGNVGNPGDSRLCEKTGGIGCAASCSSTS